MLGSVNIRFASIDDLERIVEIYNQAVETGSATADMEKISINDRIEWFNDHDQDKYPLYVLDNQGFTYGWAALSPYRKGRGGLRHTAEISYYLDYDHHGKGYGSKLISHMISDCQRLGIRNIFAILLEINQSSIFVLEKFGFEKWGYLPKVVNLKGLVCGQYIYGLNLTGDQIKDDRWHICS